MDADVLIVGAGPSGAITAKRLAEEGYKVLVLEQGDWPDYSKATVTREDFPLTAGRDWGWDPNARKAPGRLPDRRLRVRHHGADVERRRRRHRRLRRPVAAQHAVGLPREDARRRRRRLAADLRGPRALLRARGARLRHLRPGRRHRLPARRGPAAAARAARPGGQARGQGPQRARLALVAGAAGDRHAQVRRAEPVRAARHLPAGLRGRRQGHRRPHALAARARARRRAAHARARAGAHRPARTGSSAGAIYVDGDGVEHEVKAGRDDPVRQRRRHAAAAAALRRRRRPGQLLRAWSASG